ncbi:MAG: hypothetical protein ACUVQX_06395 [Candidatus Bathycorpusculaceae bacterium]
MKICNTHVHLGKSGPWQPYINPTIYLDELIRLFDKYNVEQAVVFPNPNVKASGSLPDFVELSVEVDGDGILFGLDISYLRYLTQIVTIKAAQISQRSKRKIFYDNFQRLFSQNKMKAETKL